MIAPSDSDAAERPGPSEVPPGSGRSGMVRRILTACIGVLLLALAAWAIRQNWGAVSAAIDSARNAPWWAMALLAVLPLANILAVTGSLWVMTARYARVSYAEMLALVSTGWFLNNLPLRPGLLGRVAYLKVVHGVSLRDNVHVLVQNLVCAALAVGIMLLALWLARADQSGWLTGLLVIGPLIALVVAATAMHRATSNAQHWRWAACAALRYADIIVWAARYWLLFWVFGAPLTPLRAGAVAAASEAAMLSPIQLGLREWVVALTSSWLAAAGPTTHIASSPLVSQGLLVDLSNRGIEVVLGVPLALIAIAWLSRSLRTRARAPAAAADARRYKR